MSHETTVSITALKDALCDVLDKVHAQRGDAVDLDEDLYYVLPADAVYTIGVTPDGSRCTIGSLVNDIDTLAQLRTGSRQEELIVWHDLAHLTGILQRLAVMDLP